MSRCIEFDCRRERMAGYSRCDSCLRSLFLRIFGRTADYPVKAAA